MTSIILDFIAVVLLVFTMLVVFSRLSAFSWEESIILATFLTSSALLATAMYVIVFGIAKAVLYLIN